MCEKLFYDFIRHFITFVRLPEIELITEIDNGIIDTRSQDTGLSLPDNCPE